jgi:hypothetical protein
MGRRAGCRTRCSYLHFWDVGERRRDLDGDFVSSPGAGTLEEEEGSYRKVDCACILQPFEAIFHSGLRLSKKVKVRIARWILQPFW